MTIRHKYAAGKVVVTCNTCFDPAANEEFALRTEYEAITARIKQLGWTVKHMFSNHFAHHCPKCSLVNRTSASYQQRIHA